MYQRIVSIDFDGVIIRKIFERDFAMQDKVASGKITVKKRVTYFLDKVWTAVNQTWRKPVEGSLNGLRVMKANGWELVLLTSRKSYMRKITLDWVKKWGYDELYTKYFFNNTYIGGADSKVINVGKIGSDIHIDDNWPTVVKLAETYPKMMVWYLGETKHKTSIKNIFQFKNWAKIVEKIGKI
jgi:uncharacterized HAD superfamily protein